MTNTRTEINVVTNEMTVIELTPEEITAAKNNDVITYKMLRSAEYPPITDYIDGIVKGDQAQIAKYISDCLMVKDKYPKI